MKREKIMAKRNLTIIVIVLLLILLVVAIVYIIYDKYTIFKQQREFSAFQQWAQAR